MMQVVPKWEVKLCYEGDRVFKVWISDNFMSNVLRKVAEMDFTENALEQPYLVTVSAMGRAPSGSPVK